MTRNINNINTSDSSTSSTSNSSVFSTNNSNNNDSGFLINYNTSKYGGIMRKSTDGEYYVVDEENDANNATYNNLGNLHVKSIIADSIVSQSVSTIDSIAIKDNSILLASGNMQDLNNIGFYFQHSDTKFSGFIKEKAGNVFKLLDLQALPTSLNQSFLNASYGSLHLKDLISYGYFKLLNTTGWANSFRTNPSQSIHASYTLPLTAPSNNNVLTSDASGNLNWSNKNEAPGNFTINTSATTLDNQNYKALFGKKYNNSYCAMTMGDDFIFLTNLPDNTNVNGLTMFTRDNLAGVRTGLLTVSGDMRFQANNQKFFYLKQPTNQTIDLSLTLPNVAPTVGQVPSVTSVVDGDAVIGWTTPTVLNSTTDISVKNITSNGIVNIPAPTSGNYGFSVTRNSVDCGMEIESFGYGSAGQAICNFQVNCGRNFSKNDTYHGGIFRIDTRTSGPQFEWLWKNAGGSSESRLMNLNNSNVLTLGNNSTYNGQFVINKRNTIQDAIVINSNAPDNDYMRILYQSNRYSGFSTRDNAKWECGVAQTSTQSSLDRWYVGRSGISGNDLVVNKDGNVGIGVSDPSALFMVKNATLCATSAGNVGLGMNNPTYQLELSSGNAAKLSGTAWAVTSDERVKKDIQDADIDICYNTVKNLKLKRFTWDENYMPNMKDKSVVGWIAQDVKQYLPKSVSIIPEKKFTLPDGTEEIMNDFHHLDADQIFLSMYGAMNKLIQKVEMLETQVASQAMEIATLKSVQL